MFSTRRVPKTELTFPHIAPRYVVIALVFPTILHAAGSPQLDNIIPRGAQRGCDITVEFSGVRLDKALDVIFSEPGIELTGLEQVDAKRVKCTLRIQSGCRIGLRPLRLRTTQGVSNVKLFSVGRLPEIAEQEPNNGSSKAQTVSLPVTINGRVTNEDVDRFAFQAKAGQVLAFEVEGIRLGDTLFDPHLVIYDEAGRPLAAEDDTCLTRQDPAIIVTVPNDGIYHVELRETAYGGNGRCHYRLHMGSFPRPFAVVPMGGQIGTELELNWVGDPSTGKQQVKLPDVATTGFGILPDRANVLSPSPVPFFLSQYPTGIESEPNNDDDRATPITVPGGVSGVVDGERDVDCFVFEGKKGQTFEAAVYARRLRSSLDPVISIRKHKGPNVGYNDDGAGPDSVIRFTCKEDGKKVVSVRDLLYRSGPTLTYFLEITPVRPQLFLTMLPKKAGIAVAAGNRAAVLLTGHRKDFGGGLKVSLTGLPESVTPHTDVMHEAVHQLPVVFEVSADAKATGAMVDLVAEHVDPARKIQGRLRHSLELVKYENQPFYTFDVNCLALAVTEAIPFKIEVVEPPVPIVQRGSMSLPVKLERFDDFKGDVTIRLLWNPPGIGSGTLHLKGNQAEGVIHLNARGNARAGIWKTVAVATAKIGGGDFQVASRLFSLRVAEPLVDFSIARTRTELGRPVEVAVKVDAKTAFEGEAKTELLGLPPKVTTTSVNVKPDAKEIGYPLVVNAKAPPGRHGGLFIRAVVMKDGHPIVHHSTRGELILDKPLPPKDPKQEAAREEAKRKAAEAKAKRKAERIAAAKKRKAEREARRKASRQKMQTEAKP